MFQELICSNTGITNLNINKQSDLFKLYCNNTRISSLDVSNYPNLMYLDCYNTDISELDVSKNTTLQELFCSNTGITSLDVSKNTRLKKLDCNNNSLAYLNIGTNPNLKDLTIPSPTIDLEVNQNTFHITDKFSGIDKDKITVISGADYDSATGVFSNCKTNTPIVYTYDCGTANSLNIAMKVTLNLNKADSSISITNKLDKTYDGKPVTPAVNKTGSTGEVRYKWEKKTNDTWDTIDAAPANAGTYRVTAILADNDSYKVSESEAVSFVIAPKSIETIKVPDITANTNLDNLILKDNDKTLIKGTDYDITKVQDGNKVTLTITFKGNYTEAVTKSYTVDDKDNSSVQTSDATATGLWAVLIAITATATALLRGKKRKEE